MVKLAPRFVLVVAAWVVFIYSWDINMMQTTMPFLSREVGAAAFMVGLIMGVYALTNSVGNIVLGRLSDIRGRKIALTIGFAGVTMAVLLYNLVDTPEGLLVIRIVHGFFGGALGPCCAAVLADLAPPERRGATMGLWVVAYSLGTAIAPMLAGSVAAQFGYFWVFLIMAIAYVVTIAILWTLLPETRRPTGSVPSCEAGVSAAEKPELRKIFRRRNVWISYAGIFSLFWVISALRRPLH